MDQDLTVPPTNPDAAPPAYGSAETHDSPIGLSIVAKPDGKDFLVTLSPPKEPAPDPNDLTKPGARAPVDIVLVIDVSLSMDYLAPAPKSANLTVLDIVKHAVRTIVTSMQPDDRVSVVTFSKAAKVVVPLRRTDEPGKTEIVGIVERLTVEPYTNIWAGLEAGMNVLTSKSLSENQQATDDKKNDGIGSVSPQRLSSIFLLTDGQPNVEPPKGHIPALKHYLESHPPASTRFAINTFGFGYDVDSQLLNNLAAVGKGAYGFIPDSGMVGTVFVHAAANTYATFCDACELSIELDDGALVKNLEVLGGLESVKASWGVRIDLGAVQYGQTKDVVLRIPKGLGKRNLTATAKYRPWSSPAGSPDTSITRAVNSGAFLPTADPNLVYHTHRVTFVQEILNLFDGGGILPTMFRRSPASAPSSKAVRQLSALAKAIRRDFDEAQSEKPPQADALALAKDIEGEVIMALDGKSDKGAFNKWGRHYLPSLARSHQRQQCGNFKDEGLQVYGRESPLFIKSRNDMDTLFDNLPPPIATGDSRSYDPNAVLAAPSEVSRASVSMGSWNMKSAPCFAGKCLVALATSHSSEGGMVRVDNVKRGTRLQTPAGPRSVAGIIRTAIRTGELEMCSLGQVGLLITPWHPVKMGFQWVFPADVCPSQKVTCEAVYSILLEPDQDSGAHSVWIGGVLCVTLGHGIVRSSTEHADARAHQFLGDYNKIVRCFSENPQFYEEDGVLEAYGTIKSSEGGLICGFDWGVDEYATTIQQRKMTPKVSGQTMLLA